jgi:hypothetical protein
MEMSVDSWDKTGEKKLTEKGKTVGIKSWPKDDRPREKLHKKGAGALSNSELLAILLTLPERF